MPRKPKPEQKQKVTIVVNGTPVAVTLTPPTHARKSWFAYWTGLVTSKSTGAATYDDAVKAAEHMLTHVGQKPDLVHALLSDEEFEAIQHRHYGNRTGKRPIKTLQACLEAISAFRQITGISPVASATADDCAAFQYKALATPKNWRSKYPKSKEVVPNISRNTVVKWMKELQAAFERVNINAGKKCVRGVVPAEKLLTQNPWRQFTWIEPTDKPIRQFDGEELVSILDYFATTWGGITAATAAVKFAVWSGSRLAEFTALHWDACRQFGDEVHFDWIGKWGVRKWARIPLGLHRELTKIRMPNTHYVFAAYTGQLRAFHAGTKFSTKVGEQFTPKAFANWFQDRIGDWVETTGANHASPHVFRKTNLQLAYDGEDINRLVAEDAQLTPSVMTEHYVTKSDEAFRAASNRTHARILASLRQAGIAEWFGYIPPSDEDRLKEELRRATAAGDWNAVKILAAKLESVKSCEKPEPPPNSNFTVSPEVLADSSVKKYTRQGSNL
jgi:hypothetical protein